MFVSFNQPVNYNRQQRQNFGAIPGKDLVCKNIAKARILAAAAIREGIYDGVKITNTADNVKDVKYIYQNATNPATSLAIRGHMEDIATAWKIPLEELAKQ